MLNTARPHLIRYGALLVIILVVTHLAAYRKLPFEEGYVFPWYSFFVVSIFGFLICTFNWWIYKRFPYSHQIYWKQLLGQMIINIGATALLHSFLYPFINVVVLGDPISWFGYFKYFVICAMIVIGLISVLSAVDRGNEETKSISSAFLTVKTHKKEVVLRFAEIVAFYIKGGLVFVCTEPSGRMLTQYTSLDQLDKLLIASDFFRINRQVIVNKRFVRSIQSLNNRRLSLDLTNPLGEEGISLNISRYKNQKFRHWLNGA